MKEETAQAAPDIGAFARARGWLKGRPLKLKILLAALGLGLALVLGSLAVEAWRGLSFRKEDERLEQVGNQAGREADAALGRANEAAVDRQVNEREYNRREPLRRKADADADAARARLAEAEQRYRDEKKNFRVSTGPLAERLDRAVSNSRAVLAEPDPADGDGRAGDRGGRPVGEDDRGAKAHPHAP